MYVLHHSPDSASLIIRLVLLELNLPHDARLIDRPGGALNSPQYRAMHPLGLIPALETPDGPMFETAAMLLYLSDRHPGLAPAPADADRAAFLKWLFFISTNIHPTLLQLFYPERTAGPDCKAAVVSHAKARMHGFLGILDAMVTRDAPAYLSDKNPTILGYYIAVLMRWMNADFPVKNYPALHNVLAYLETRPAALQAASLESLGPTIFSNPA